MNSARCYSNRCATVPLQYPVLGPAQFGYSTAAVPIAVPSYSAPAQHCSTRPTGLLNKAGMSQEPTVCFAKPRAAGRGYLNRDAGTGFTVRIGSVLRIRNRELLEIA